MTRTFRIRACPDCGAVDMPRRDGLPYCHQPPDVCPNQPRLAWFDVTEAPTLANRLNEQARAGREPRKGFEVFTHHAGNYAGGVPFYSARNWATGESRNLTVAEAEVEANNADADEAFADMGGDR